MGECGQDVYSKTLLCQIDDQVFRFLEAVSGLFGVRSSTEKGGGGIIFEVCHVLEVWSTTQYIVTRQPELRTFINLNI